MRENLQVQPTRKSNWLSQINEFKISVLVTVPLKPLFFCKALPFSTFFTPIYIGAKNRKTSFAFQLHSIPFYRLVLFELTHFKIHPLFFRLE